MTELLGLLRLGAAMGVIHGVKVETMTALLAEGMPATLSLSTEPLPNNDHERELLRAKAVRERIFGQ
jgi:protein-arginine kinase